MLRTVLSVVSICLLTGAQQVDENLEDGAERMFGGMDVGSTDSGFVAYISGTTQLSNAEPISTICGGAIINSTLVLTSATCVYKMQTASISVGYKNKSSDAINTRSNQTAYMVDKFIYPLWEKNTGLNDIAIIRVFPPFYFNEFVYPIALPKSSVIKGDAMAKLKDLTWFSWGAVNASNYTKDIMQKSNFIYMPSKACTTFYLKRPFWFNVPTTVMCMNLTTTLGYCNMDNGSPVAGYDSKTKAPYLAGLAAMDRDNLCGPNNTIVNFYTPDLFTRIDPFYKWIAAMGGPKQS